jgi:hypothetical protein
MSAADDWYAYPALTGSKKAITCTAWGCSNERFQAWWAAHLPHVAGGSTQRGCDNWWKYIVDPDGRLAPCTGDGCKPEYERGHACVGDQQCATQHCSCQAGHMACTDVAGPACPNPDWDSCMIDADCQSGVCGCNGAAPPKVCLPGGYPRDCAPP